MLLTDIEIRGFKSFRDARMQLGGFNLLVGANGSGKSNFLDALRFLRGVGRSNTTLSEMLDGKPGDEGIAWKGIRGGSANAVMRGASSFEFVVGLDDKGGPRYRLCVGGMRLLSESWIGRVSYDQVSFEIEEGPDRFQIRNRIPSMDLEVQRDRPMLATVGDRVFELSLHDFRRLLVHIQHFNPRPEILRGYSSPGWSPNPQMSEHGENFAAVVAEIANNARKREAFLEWIAELPPERFDDFEILRGALDEPMFALKERGATKPMPAPALSDGTLRFAALVAMVLQRDSSGILLLEEIEDGFHPSRARLLLELLKSHARGDLADHRAQVIATTHSPAVLSWLDPEDLKHTFHFRREEDGSTTVRPLSEIPGLDDAMRTNSLGDLFTEGWLEAAP